MSQRLKSFNRVFALWATVSKLVIDGKREPEEVADVLQRIVDTKQYLHRIYTLPLDSWEVAVFALVQNGKFSDFLGGSAKKLNRLRATQYLVEIVFKSYFSAFGGRGGNFFIITEDDTNVAEDLSNVRVMEVRVISEKGFSTVIHDFTSDNVWNKSAGHRIFFLE